MLGKIMKYDIKATYPWIVILDVAALLVGIITYTTMGVVNANEGVFIFDMLAAVLPTLFSFVLMAASIVTFWVPTYHFYKSVFGNEGYLTNTLPVKPVTILTGKGLVFSLWTALNCVVMAFVVLGVAAASSIVYDDASGLQGLMAFGAELKEVFIWLTQVSPLIPIYAVLAFVIGIFNGVAFVYMCLALGNLFRSHKLIWSAVIGVALTNIFQILGIIGLSTFATLIYMPAMPDDTFEGMGEQEAMRIVLDWALPYINVGMVVFVLATVIFFVITERIMSKKLNIA